MDTDTELAYPESSEAFNSYGRKSEIEQALLGVPTERELSLLIQEIKPQMEAGTSFTREAKILRGGEPLAPNTLNFDYFSDVESVCSSGAPSIFSEGSCSGLSDTSSLINMESRACSDVVKSHPDIKHGSLNGFIYSDEGTMFRGEGQATLRHQCLNRSQSYILNHPSVLSLNEVSAVESLRDPAQKGSELAEFRVTEFGYPGIQSSFSHPLAGKLEANQASPLFEAEKSIFFNSFDYVTASSQSKGCTHLLGGVNLTKQEGCALVHPNDSAVINPSLFNNILVFMNNDD